MRASEVSKVSYERMEQGTESGESITLLREGVGGKSTRRGQRELNL